MILFYSLSSKKKLLDEVVIPDNFYDGWYAGINGGVITGLNYLCRPFSQLNDARHLAQEEGYKLGEKMLEEAISRRNTTQAISFVSNDDGHPEIPEQLRKDCYALSGIDYKEKKKRS